MATNPENNMDLLLLLLITLGAAALVGLVTFVYVIRNILKKLDTYETWISRFRREIEVVDAKLKVVDEKKLFNRDDDVGFVFSEITRIISEFNDSNQ